MFVQYAMKMVDNTSTPDFPKYSVFNLSAWKIIKSIILTVTGLVVLTSAVSATKYIVHEKRQFENPKWIPSDIKLDKRLAIPVSIGLTQRNLANGHAYPMDVSDPASPNYGKHWTAEQITEAFDPLQEILDSIKLWLAEHGILEDRITLTRGSDWIRLNSTVEETEKLTPTARGRRTL